MAEFIFRVTFRQQLRMLTWMLVVYSIIFTIAVYGFGFTLDYHYFYAYLLFFLLDICPTLLVHAQYVIVNWGCELVINKELETIVFTSPKESLRCHFDDIVLLQHVASYGGGAWYSFSAYRYFRIGFADKKEIVITCLMVKDIKTTLEMLLHLKAQKKLKIVAFVGR